MTSTIHDHVVVGGGIVGLSTAGTSGLRAAPGRRVMVLEKEADVGRHQTGHNSGVIHCGIYYRPGSLKARYAKRGDARQYRYANERGMPVR